MHPQQITLNRRLVNFFILFSFLYQFFLSWQAKEKKTFLRKPAKILFIIRDRLEHIDIDRHGRQQVFVYAHF